MESGFLKPGSLLTSNLNSVAFLAVSSWPLYCSYIHLFVPEEAKYHPLTRSSLGGPISSCSKVGKFLRMCLTNACSTAESIGASLGVYNRPKLWPTPWKVTKMAISENDNFDFRFEISDPITYMTMFFWPLNASVSSIKQEVRLSSLELRTRTSSQLKTKQETVPD